VQCEVPICARTAEQQENPASALPRVPRSRCGRYHAAPLPDINHADRAAKPSRTATVVRGTITAEGTGPPSLPGIAPASGAAGRSTHEGSTRRFAHPETGAGAKNGRWHCKKTSAYAVSCLCLVDSPATESRPGAVHTNPGWRQRPRPAWSLRTSSVRSSCPYPPSTRQIHSMPQ
jgi:hypothetical protein